MNYLELVNTVLRRLREGEVSSVSDTPYSKMIGEFINDAKRQVEDSYSWNALTETLSATTTNDIFNYVLEGSGQRFKVIDIINDTSNNFLESRPTSYMNKLFLLENPEKGSPMYYNFNGLDSNGDTQVDIYPIPDGVYNIRFNIYKPQLKLTNNGDVLYVPYEPVVFNATARALAERGEDGGIQSNEMYGLYQQSLGDAIAIETSRYPEEQEWIAS
jgi:hypothetical protein